MFETDLISYVQDKGEDGTTSRSYFLNFINLKAGLTHALDLQVLVQSFVRENETNGFGETILRLKWNVLGNDGGRVALGLMPFAKLPTGTNGIGNGKVEGGVVLPVAIGLPEAGLSLGTMVQYNRVQDSLREEDFSEFAWMFTVGRDLFGGLSVFTELFNGWTDSPGSEWVATFDTGFTYGLNADIQLDAGVNIGLTDAADDLNPFLGLSVRF